MAATPNPAAVQHLPPFITAPGETDILMVVAAVLLLVAVVAIGLLFLRLHSLPERIAHKGHKLQFEIVAVLCLLALFTHVHLFWVIALLLALIDIPDFGWPLRRMAGALEKIAGMAPGEGARDVPDGPDAGATASSSPYGQEALKQEPPEQAALAREGMLQRPEPSPTSNTTSNTTSQSTPTTTSASQTGS